MIWYDAIRKHPQRNPLTSQTNQLHKGSVITVLMEYLDLCVTSIDDVIADVAYRGSGCAWHAAIYLGPCSLGKRKEECPLFYSFYLANPARVKQLAKANDQNVLLVGMFAGFQGDKAHLLVESIYLDELGLQPILHKQLVLPARKLPFSSNGITRDLIEGHSARAKSADAVWRKMSSSIPVSIRAFRQVEFVIQATAKYDQTVGTRVNVLEVSPHKNPHWLQ